MVWLPLLKKRKPVETIKVTPIAPKILPSKKPTLDEYNKPPEGPFTPYIPPSGGDSGGGGSNRSGGGGGKQTTRDNPTPPADDKTFFNKPKPSVEKTNTKKIPPVIVENNRSSFLTSINEKEKKQSAFLISDGPGELIINTPPSIFDIGSGRQTTRNNPTPSADNFLINTKKQNFNEVINPPSLPFVIGSPKGAPPKVIGPLVPQITAYGKVADFQTKASSELPLQGVAPVIPIGSIPFIIKNKDFFRKSGEFFARRRRQLSNEQTMEDDFLFQLPLISEGSAPFIPTGTLIDTRSDLGVSSSGTVSLGKRADLLFAGNALAAPPTVGSDILKQNLLSSGQTKLDTSFSQIQNKINTGEITLEQGEAELSLIKGGIETDLSNSFDKELSARQNARNSASSQVSHLKNAGKVSIGGLEETGLTIGALLLAPELAGGVVASIGAAEILSATGKESKTEKITTILGGSLNLGIGLSALPTIGGQSGILAREAAVDRASQTQNIGFEEGQLLDDKFKIGDTGRAFTSKGTGVQSGLLDGGEFTRELKINSLDAVSKSGTKSASGGNAILETNIRVKPVDFEKDFFKPFDMQFVQSEPFGQSARILNLPEGSIITMKTDYPKAGFSEESIAISSPIEPNSFGEPRFLTKTSKIDDIIISKTKFDDELIIDINTNENKAILNFNTYDEQTILGINLNPRVDTSITTIKSGKAGVVNTFETKPFIDEPIKPSSFDDFMTGTFDKKGGGTSSKPSSGGGVSSLSGGSGGSGSGFANFPELKLNSGSLQTLDAQSLIQESSKNLGGGGFKNLNVGETQTLRGAIISPIGRVVASSPISSLKLTQLKPSAIALDLMDVRVGNGLIQSPKSSNFFVDSGSFKGGSGGLINDFQRDLQSSPLRPPKIETAIISKNNSRGSGITLTTSGVTPTTTDTFANAQLTFPKLSLNQPQKFKTRFDLLGELKSPTINPNSSVTNPSFSGRFWEFNPFIPLGLIPFPSGIAQFSNPGIKVGRTFGRTPSFAAVQLGITAPSKNKFEFSGLVERPIITKGKKKRRKGIQGLFVDF